MALVRPARFVPEVSVSAVAARDAARARKFAGKHHIAVVHESYDALLADPDIDAVYNPLPNSLHAPWTIRALEAGKHVLCEKPLAANAAEAERMAEAAERSGRLLMEAFHYRYHPLAARMKAVVDSGSLGRIEHVEAHMCIPLPFPKDIRYQYDLAGGATMDTGCYAISLVRHLAGGEPEVLSARARLMSPRVDRAMSAELRFGDQVTGRISCSLLSAALVRISARVRGSQGEMRVLNPVAPHLFHYLRIRGATGSSFERVGGEATYTHQLRAFAAAVRGGQRPLTDAADAIANMRVIDEVYRRAGMQPRGT